MAEIFVARRCGPGGFAKQVALKRVLPELARQEEFRHMFADEARLCASLSHPGLVQVFDYGEVDGTPYLAMEWVDGCDLATLLASSGPLPPETAAFTMAEVARALTYVHDARDDAGRPLGIVHRDLSPGNVLVTRNGDVKIGDFGVAKARGRLARTDAGRLKGTLAYLAPEQVSCGAVDRRADVYAAGLLLFELLTGERYVTGETEVELLKAAAHPTARTASSVRKEVGRALDDVLKRALAVAPEERHPHASALERQLRALCADAADARAVLARLVATCQGSDPPERKTDVYCGEPEPFAGRVRRAWARSRVPILLGGAALLVLVGVMVWIGVRPPGEGDRRGTATIEPAEGDSGSPDLAMQPGDRRQGLDAAPDPSNGGDDASVRQPMADAEALADPPRRPNPTRTRPLADAGEAGAAVTRDASSSVDDGSASRLGPDAAAATEQPDLAAHLAEGDRLRASLGLRQGDDPEADRIRAELVRLVGGGASTAEVERTAVAYRARLEAVEVNRELIDRKLRRATARIRRAGATAELDSLSQQALSQALAGDYVGANRTLNRIFELTGP